MMIRLRMACASVLATILSTSAAVAQQPARDLPRVSLGTGLVAGTVVSDDGSARPLRRARVAIASSERLVVQTSITDDQGHFAFASLPAGRYTLTGTKEGFVTTGYGARGMSRAGNAIALAEQQQVTGIVLKLPRASVIA